MMTRRHRIAPPPARPLPRRSPGRLGDLEEDLEAKVDELIEYGVNKVYSQVVARIPELEEALRPQVRQMAKVAVEEALTSPAFLEAKQELRGEAQKGVLILVAASFAASFLAEWWGKGGR